MNNVYQRHNQFQQIQVSPQKHQRVSLSPNTQYRAPPNVQYGQQYQQQSSNQIYYQQPPQQKPIQQNQPIFTSICQQVNQGINFQELELLKKNVQQKQQKIVDLENGLAQNSELEFELQEYEKKIQELNYEQDLFENNKHPSQLFLLKEIAMLDDNIRSQKNTHQEISEEMQGLPQIQKQIDDTLNNLKQNDNNDIENQIADTKSQLEEQQKILQNLQQEQQEQEQGDRDIEDMENKIMLLIEELEKQQNNIHNQYDLTAQNKVRQEIENFIKNLDFIKNNKDLSFQEIKKIEQIIQDLELYYDQINND